MGFQHTDDSAMVMRLLNRAHQIQDAKLMKEEEEVYERLVEDGKLTRQAVKILLRNLHEEV